jgi:hypothetical protein
MHLSMVDPKGLYLNKNVTWSWFRIGNLLHDKTVDAAELLENNCPHSDFLNFRSVVCCRGVANASQCYFVFISFGTGRCL